MESKLFSWDGWDEIAVGHLQFYKVVLKQPLGPHCEGSEFDVADLNFQTGVLNLYNEEDAKTGTPTRTFNLEFNVV